MGIDELSAPSEVIQIAFQFWHSRLSGIAGDACFNVQDGMASHALKRYNRVSGFIIIIQIKLLITETRRAPGSTKTYQ